MVRNRKGLYSVIFLLILAAVIYWRWISFTIFTGGDWPYYFPETFSSFPFSFTWLSLNDMGVANIIAWRSILATGQSIFAIFGFGSNVSEKFLIFWPTIIFANIFSYLLFKKILKSTIGAVTGSIVFNYSTYYITASTAFLLYSASPWVLLSLLLYIDALESRKKYLQIFSGLALFIAGSYDFRVAYIGIFLLFAYSLYHLIVFDEIRSLAQLTKRFLSSCVVFFFFGLLSIYWVLPMVKLGSLTDNTVLSRGLFGNEFLNVLYAFTLYHPFWTGGKPTWFIVQPICIYFWLIPFFAFSGLYFNRKKKHILFFGFVALVGIFLTKQVSQPFSEIYPWLNAHLLGFSAFREATKFYFLVVLGYSVLIGSFVTYIVNNYKSQNKYLKYSLVIFISSLFLWNAKPIITGDISGIFVPRHIPTDYSIVKNLILKDENYYRTLWIPTISTWDIYTADHPELNMGAMLTYYDYWTSRKSEQPSYGKHMVEDLNLPLSNNLLDISSVKYVILPLADKENDGDFFSNFGEERKYYATQLSKIPWLKKQDIGTKEILVYLNQNYRPFIYTTEGVETINELKPIKYPLRYQMINPAEYSFKINNINHSFYLNMSENYNSQWNIKLGKFSWIESIIKNNYSNNSKYHLRNNAGLNSFYININELCVQNNCTRNADGSYNISGTLYFSPQGYMYLGIIISGASFVIVFTYLLYMYWKGYYAKRKK